jgi:HlyD family secretion protein
LSRSSRGRLARVSAIVCIAAFGCAKESAPRAGAPAASDAAAPRRVEIARAVSVTMGQEVLIAGTLAAQDDVVVKSKVAGRLQSIDVDLGSVVANAQPIARIEPVDYQLRVEQALAMLAQAKASLGLAPEDDRSNVVIEENSGVRQAQATLEEARGNYERSQTLVEKKLIGRAEFDTARATLARAESEAARAKEQVYQLLAVLKQRKAELALAKQQLGDTTIRSPLDGIVQVRHASAGEFLAQGADVATVVRIDPLRLRVDVPERDAARIAVGQEVSVRVDESDKRYRGRIARLSPVLDVQNRTLVVEAEIPNPGELKPGSFARARIALGEGAPVVAIPQRALVVFAGIEKVVGIEQGRAIEKPIRTGRRSGELVEVLEGLEPGTSVVLDPGTLQQGQPVQVSGERTISSAALGTGERESRVE